MGGQIFFRDLKGGQVFCIGQQEGPEFFVACKRGGAEKIDDPRSQTESPTSR